MGHAVFWIPLSYISHGIEVAREKTGQVRLMDGNWMIFERTIRPGDSQVNWRWHSVMSPLREKWMSNNTRSGNLPTRIFKREIEMQKWGRIEWKIAIMSSSFCCLTLSHILRNSLIKFTGYKDDASKSRGDENTKKLAQFWFPIESHSIIRLIQATWFKVFTWRLMLKASHYIFKCESWRKIIKRREKKFNLVCCLRLATQVIINVNWWTKWTGDGEKKFKNAHEYENV